MREHEYEKYAVVQGPARGAACLGPGLLRLGGSGPFLFCPCPRLLERGSCHLPHSWWFWLAVNGALGHA